MFTGINKPKPKNATDVINLSKLQKIKLQKLIKTPVAYLRFLQLKPVKNFPKKTPL